MFGLQFICLLCAAFHITGGYKILVVFPIPGTSHAILGEAFIRPLLEAGHEVTYITSVLVKNPPAQLRQVLVSSNHELLPTENVFNIAKMLTKEIDILDVSTLFYMLAAIANNTLMHENVQRLMLDPNEKFDLVINEWMYSELYSGFGSVFNCPIIWSSSMDAHFLVLSLIDEDPNPAYTADIISSETPPYTFLQRIKRLWTYIDTRVKKWIFNGIDNEIFEKAFKHVVIIRGHKYIPLDEAMYTAALMFGNSHLSTGQPVRLPVNYIPIAGYHIDPDVKPLPQDLQQIMDGAKHGFIYFSMGSLLKSKFIPSDIKNGIIKVFEELKQTVVWKFEEKLPNLPKNLHILDWAPQQSILAHPKCRLFITHGGLLSMIEALHFAVPTIGIPMFADQFVNVNRAVHKGFAKRVNLDIDTPVNLKAAIEDLLGNPRYSEKAKELSFAYHHRPASPRVQLLHWVDHVVQSRGAPHLRSPALHLVWYQKLYLDFAALIASILFVIIYAVKKILCSKKDNKSISQNKKRI